MTDINYFKELVLPLATAAFGSGFGAYAVTKHTEQKIKFSTDYKKIINANIVITNAVVYINDLYKSYKFLLEDLNNFKTNKLKAENLIKENSTEEPRVYLDFTKYTVFDLETFKSKAYETHNSHKITPYLSYLQETLNHLYDMQNILHEEYMRINEIRKKDKISSYIELFSIAVDGKSNRMVIDNYLSSLRYFEVSIICLDKIISNTYTENTLLSKEYSCSFFIKMPKLVEADINHIKIDKDFPKESNIEMFSIIANHLK